MAVSAAFSGAVTGSWTGSGAAARTLPWDAGVESGSLVLYVTVPAPSPDLRAQFAFQVFSRVTFLKQGMT